VSELWCHKVEREAAERLQALLARPDMPDWDSHMGPAEEEFDPWELFPSLYGTYSKAFDDLAIDVLERINEERFEDESLAHQMFREMLCTAQLCTYGTSPRVCFPTENFRPLLPALIERWTRYRDTMWPHTEPSNNTG